MLLATADAVPVAPTPVEVRAAAEVERRMGPRAGAHVEFARLRVRGRVLRIALVVRDGDQRPWGVRGTEARWRASLGAADLLRRLRAAGSRTTSVRLDAAGWGVGVVLGEGGRAVGDAPVLPSTAIRAEVRRRAAARGLVVRRLQPVPLDGGALRLVVRLRERQLLDAAAHDWSGLVPDAEYGGYPSSLVEVQAPDGAAVFYSASEAGGGAGGTAFGGDTWRRAVPVGPRRVPAGETDVRVTLFLPSSSGVGGRTYRARIDCANTPTRVAERRCDRLVRDRWALLVPQPTGAACDGGELGGSVRVVGTFAGRPVDRRYDGCYGGTVQRWAAALGVA